jgi:hypothetical protein
LPLSVISQSGANWRHLSPFLMNVPLRSFRQPDGIGISLFINNKNQLKILIKAITKAAPKIPAKVINEIIPTM